MTRRSFISTGVCLGAMLVATFRTAATCREDLTARLQDEAAACKQLGPASARVKVEDDRVVRWTIPLSDPAIFDYLTEAGIGPADDPRRQLRAWSDLVHQELLRVTEAAFKEREGGDRFNRETDFSLHILGQVLPTDIPEDDTARFDATYFAVAYRGSRPTYYHDGTNQDDRTVPVSDHAALEGIELTVDITPRRFVLEPREPIRGTVRLRNTGTERLAIKRRRLDDVTITNEHGVRPEGFAMQGFVSYAPFTWHHKFLEPGEEYVGQWVIHTDPLESMVHGFIVPEGRWVLSFRDLLPEDNIPTNVAPMLVEVRAKPGSYTGPRLLDVRAAGSKLILRREQQILEVVDPSSGKHLGVHRLDDLGIFRSWGPRHCVISPEGRLGAYLKPGASISVISLVSPAAERTITLPVDFELGPGGLVIERFGSDGRTLIARTNHAFIEIDLTTGNEVRRTRTQSMWARLAPDEQTLVAIDGGLVHVVGSRGNDAYAVVIARFDDPAWTRTITINGHGDVPEWTLGRKGVYLVDEFNTGVLYVPYEDGENISFETGHVSVDAESPDGRLVAFTSPGGPARDDHIGATTVEIWAVEMNMEVGRIATGDQLRPMFVSDPLRVICAVRDTRSRTRWFAERAWVCNPMIGEVTGEINLTPGVDLTPPGTKE